ncbi:hypothetical protein QNI19_26380 [Cytophagaceae bacterium DM2B3-1]|uniref:Outer membrane protein beta-barrel domain-containing protein n=1 Tax=Xanthocytophaga flava TaxID=3048013 RepID=A0ABT7CSI5_9BACT|nr:hypothetical protein [Xanthocytophaga flavus]MDJ1496491.1 hypothetical protein [Xanthocytophaga flavus]
MRKTLTICVLFLCCLSGFAQSKPLDQMTIGQIDSVQKSIERKYAELDSIRNAYKLDSLSYELHKLELEVSGKEKNYTAFMVFTQTSFNKVSSFNQELQGLGFPTLTGHSTGIGFGMAIKRKRLLHEGFLVVNFNNKVSKGDDKVWMSGENIFNYQLGFAVLNRKRFQLYPFAGISYGLVSIELRKKRNMTDPNSLEGIAQAINEARISKNEIQISTGLQLDYHYSFNNGLSGLIIGLKYGLSRDVLSDNYAANGTKVNYNPDIIYRNTFLALSLKIY